MDFFGRHPDEEGARLIRHRVKDKRDQVVSGVIRAVGAMFGVKGLQAIAPQVDYKNPRILRTFVVTHFSLGGIEMLGQILEKAAHVRSSVLDNPYLDSIEGCLDLLNMRDKMPKDLFAELSKASMAEAVPVPSPVVSPIAVPPPVAMPVPPAFQPLVFEPQPQPQPQPQVPTQPMPQYQPQPVPQLQPLPQPQPVPQLQPQPQPQPQVIPVTMPMPQPIPVTMPMPQPQTQAPYEPAPMASPPVPLPPLFSPVPLPAQAVEPVLNEPLLPRVDIEVAEGPRKPKSKPPAEFRSGVKYFNLGKYSKAKKSFNSALQEHPDLVKAFLYLGLIAFEEKEFETARDHLLRFLESNPGNRKANLVMVKIFKQLREWTNLVGILERLLGLDYVCDESNIKLMKELGSAYIFVREFEKAKQTLETVFHFDPTDPQSDYHLAMSYFHLQDFTKAEALLRDILREVPQGNRLQVMAESLMEKIR